jgi:hypothetical protein
MVTERATNYVKSQVFIAVVMKISPKRRLTFNVLYGDISQLTVLFNNISFT